MKTSYLNRDVSAALKGIALIAMFFHHFFTIPSWYVEGISYPFLEAVAQYLREPMKICVPIFAFLTGYFYFFASRKTVRYSLRKMTDLLIPHWVTCVLMTALAMALGCYAFTVSGFLREMAGMGSSIMLFSWYVAFYCISMLILPLCDKLSSGSLAGDVLLLLVLPPLAVKALAVTMDAQFHLNAPLVYNALESAREWFPVTIVGFLFAKYRLFETYMDSLTEKFSSKPGKLLLWLCMCGIAFAGRLALPRFRLGAIHPAGTWTELIYTMDILYAPMFVYGMAKLLESVKLPGVTRVLGAIGKQSLYMWFLHAMFFNCCREVLQPLVYFPKNPVLVLIFALAVCYGLAVLIDLAVKPVIKWKNKYL